MRRIWKFGPVFYTGTFDIPEGAAFLHVGVQKDQIFLWYLLDPQAPLVPVKVAVYGTGWPVEDEGVHLGTVQIKEFVWHVFKL